MKLSLVIVASFVSVVVAAVPAPEYTLPPLPVEFLKMVEDKKADYKEYIDCLRDVGKCSMKTLKVKAIITKAVAAHCKGCNEAEISLGEMAVLLLLEPNKSSGSTDPMEITLDNLEKLEDILAYLFNDVKSEC